MLLDCTSMSAIISLTLYMDIHVCIHKMSVWSIWTVQEIRQKDMNFSKMNVEKKMPYSKESGAASICHVCGSIMTSVFLFTFEWYVIVVVPYQDKHATPWGLLKGWLLRLHLRLGIQKNIQVHNLPPHRGCSRSLQGLYLLWCHQGEVLSQPGWNSDGNLA